MTAPGESERFDHYMDRVLYGPGGFYATEGTAGRRRGDFITSPEVGPLFGAVVARAIDQWWTDAGRPDDFTVYDVGCGPGTLLRSIRLARGGEVMDRPWTLVGVDRAAEADLVELPDDLSGSVVLANELLDNLPFRIVERSENGFSEVHVSPVGRELLLPTDLELDIPVGSRAPVHQQARQWLSETLGRGPAVLCLFDYGAPTTKELASRGGWLRTYHRHQRGQDPLVEPGALDITTDIGWDQLPAPDALLSQADFLRRWSIDELVDEGREYWRAHAHAPDLQAMRMRSRISEAEALMDSSALGQWWVAIWQSHL